MTATTRFKLLPAIALIVAVVTAMTAGCSSASSRLAESVDTVLVYHQRHKLPDTLRVATLWSPTSYFIYREEKMGFDYDMVSRFAADKGMQLKLEVASSLSDAIEMLDSGLIDILAFEIPVTAEFKERVISCGPERITSQVLVQPRRQQSDSIITDVTQLIGRDVYVERDSKYQHRLVNLNEELGGGVRIHVVDRDTLITEDLIEMVSNGSIPLTVVDSDIAEINKTYYNELDITLPVSFPQRSAWAVAPDAQWLADTVDSWTSSEKPRQARADLLKRYFELSKADSPSSFAGLSFAGGKASPFDHLFKTFARRVNWDWRLLAAQGYVESRFDSTVVSWAGARGIMQLMPSTARAYGLSGSLVTDNRANIEAAVKVIADLDKTLSRYVSNGEERKKFIIAAYNSGVAHIIDAIALARKHGLNPAVWSGNVEKALLMKSNPEYYNDPVCRYGYFRGRQTVNYVASVYDYYNRCRSKVPQ